MEATKSVILYDKTLDICARAGLDRQSAGKSLTKSLPTWVPDFSADLKSTMLDPGVCPNFKASGDTEPMVSWPFEERLDIIMLSAYPLDVITQVAQFTTDDKQYGWLGEWSLVASSLGDDYITGKSTVLAFWETCTAIRLSVTPGISPGDLFLSYALSFLGFAHQCNRSQEDMKWFENPLASRILCMLKLHHCLLEAMMDDTALQEKLSDRSGYTAMLATCLNRKLFITKQGYIGLGPKTSQVGDQIYLLSGARLPFILRRAEEPPGIKLKQSIHNMVGECYVHGTENGQVLEQNEFLWQDICVY